MLATSEVVTRGGPTRHLPRPAVSRAPSGSCRLAAETDAAPATSGSMVMARPTMRGKAARNLPLAGVFVILTRRSRVTVTFPGQWGTVRRQHPGRRPRVRKFTYRLLSYSDAQTLSASTRDAVETLEQQLEEAGADGYHLTGVLQLPTGGVLILERETEPTFVRSALSDTEP
jgi:hypothetical protein